MSTVKTLEAAIPIDRIVIGDRARKVDMQTVAELAEDIKARGLLQRIGVRGRDNDYTLIWGRHRLEAAATVGWTMIPAVLYPMNTPDHLLSTLELVENLRRKELSPEERAEHVLRLAALVKETEVSSAPEKTSKGKAGRPKGTTQRVAEAAGTSQQAVRRSVDKAVEAIGEPVDLERDTAAELTRKAVKVRSAPKRHKAATPRAVKPKGGNGQADLLAQLRRLDAAWPKDFDQEAFVAELAGQDTAIIKRLCEGLDALVVALEAAEGED